MNIKIGIHLMPWELDHALLTIDKLKKSIYYVNPDDTIYIDTALNLSAGIIDWEKSLIPKEYFIKKYEVLNSFIKEKFIHTPFIYEGTEVYGHLNLQKTMVSPEIDYYVAICPDVDFHEHALYYLIEYAKTIKNEYFVLTTQISKCWDSSWDILVNEKFMNIPYENYIDIDIHEIRHKSNELNEFAIKKINQFKYAGWFDLYNKKFYENLAPVLNEWNGYGPWDLYSMYVSNVAKQYNVDVQQYILENQVVWFYDTGCLRNMEEKNGDGQLKTLYKDMLTLKLGRHEQRAQIDSNINKYIAEWIEYAKQTKII